MFESLEAVRIFTFVNMSIVVIASILCASEFIIPDRNTSTHKRNKFIYIIVTITFASLTVYGVIEDSRIYEETQKSIEAEFQKLDCQNQRDYILKQYISGNIPEAAKLTQIFTENGCKFGLATKAILGETP